MSITTSHQDVYSSITKKIIADLERGVRACLKPWSVSNAEARITLPMRHNGIPCRGINILSLWGESVVSGHKSNRWMTYKQTAELGAHVRKGEHGTLVVYANTFHKVEENHRGEEVERDNSFMKGYTVFNIKQIDHLPEGYQATSAPTADPLQLIQRVESFFTAIGATFRHGGNRAFYAPAQDVIQLPPADAFRDPESYAATKAHELTHWTCQKTTLSCLARANAHDCNRRRRAQSLDTNSPLDRPFSFPSTLR